ncbi:hypothetical protein EJ05DRAFT_346063 [Pseudovirgaria hyperparasitica]|uniref:Zn(2)-C6 fungal-type domain-containing protein n=1 Tax=Pseudovirgaria hyperparasitica TaxID=470096 RepID=A0A6A6VQN7_9PEZI|nr:uncharacterized protein EJ05DRAFT_346063 [Pseudovirgaria hyperparasitica]KAF2752435.1 hypothetical protein EJ05DRAFT_346063 [Pseudovirgaria hyperparasitica]
MGASRLRCKNCRATDSRCDKTKPCGMCSRHGLEDCAYDQSRPNHSCDSCSHVGRHSRFNGQTLCSKCAKPMILARRRPTFKSCR